MINIYSNRYTNIDTLQEVSFPVMIGTPNCIRFNTDWTWSGMHEQVTEEEYQERSNRQTWLVRMWMENSERFYNLMRSSYYRERIFDLVANSPRGFIDVLYNAEPQALNEEIKWEYVDWSVIEQELKEWE